MAKLIFSLEGAFLGEYPLDKERMTIGRRPTNDIHIDNLAVSGQHAAITTIGNDSFLEDLDSTNGTFVNGKPVKKHVLQHGDVVELGKYQLKYVDEAAINAAAGGAAQDFEKTMIIRPSAMKAAAPAGVQQPDVQATAIPPAPPLQQPAPVPQPATIPQPGAAAPATAAAPKPASEAAAAEPALAHIQVLNGPSMGKELVLSKALTTLGKPGVQVAVITRRPHGYFITHVEGQSHPVVNGSSVGAQAHQLNDHDVIELAGIKMEFFFAGS